MSDEQFEFLMAIEEYKRLNGKPFPSWTEVLDVIKALGYTRAGAAPKAPQLASATDAGAPSSR
jgi:hypothetical protein